MTTRAASYGGIAACVGGIIWALFHIWYIASGITDPRQIVPLIGLSALAVSGFGICLLAILALGKLGAGGQAGVWMTIIGMIFFALGVLATSLWMESPAWFIAIAGEWLLSVGLLLFGVANLYDRVLPSLNFLPLLLALIYIPSWMIDPAGLPPPFWRYMTEWLAVGYGVGWATVGGLMIVWARRKAGTHSLTL